MEFTVEQQNFIDDRGHNLLVSAAAGSGKTAVITERVVKLITEDRYNVSELLIVTFTRAAASEMRDRIRDAISEKLMSGDLDEAQREHLSKQMTLIFSADITTIDSFCLNLVKEHFNICRIDPSFRVADEGELKLIAEEVMEVLLEERYESQDEAFYRFVDDVSTGRDDSAVAEAVRSVYGFAVARPDSGKYIASMMKEYDIKDTDELDNTAFMRELFDIADEKISLAIKILKAALNICNEASGPYIYSETLEEDISAAEGLLGIRTYQGYRTALQG
ncbi:MAG: UvrD-helicase domain-containing protein, partial [Lachnospiraceae bacterium]|nr:UvrD-helicase domain-containing protein [Lachnospiraceae bacterium]